MARPSRNVVLVVDDQSSVRRLVREVLESNGFEVLEAANGENALVIAREFPPDVALVDVNLPGRGGVDTVDGLKRLFPTLPIIIMTAVDRFNDEELTVRGVTGVLVKPFDLGEFVGAVSEAADVDSF